MNEKGLHDRQPDPEFVGRLEWQLRSEVRREREFAVRSRHRRWMRAAAIAVLSVAVGYATATAAAQLDDRAQARFALMRVEGALELAELRLDWMHEALGELGSAPNADEARGLEWGIAEARFSRDMLLLQAEEIRASGRDVRSDLTAVAVAGRDFVGERLDVEIEFQETRLAMARQELERELDPMNRAALQTDVERLEIELTRQVRERELRRDFLAGLVSGEEILRLQGQQRAGAALAAARAQLQQALAWHQEAQERFARGEVDRSQVRVAEYGVAEARVELRMARAAMRLWGGDADEPEE